LGADSKPLLRGTVGNRGSVDPNVSTALGGIGSRFAGSAAVEAGPNVMSLTRPNRFDAMGAPPLKTGTPQVPVRSAPALAWTWTPRVALLGPGKLSHDRFRCGGLRRQGAGPAV
jgi:hypothetical protein